jgi:hypothetical protein
VAGPVTPQLTIDYRNPSPLVEAPPFSEIPSRVRKFGYVPNFRECLPGDLILFCDAAPGFISHHISEAQSDFSPQHAQWTHAAVYLFDNQIVEAVPALCSGVRCRSLYGDVLKRILRVRRRKNLSDEVRYKVALSALTMLGTRYSFKTALQIALRVSRGQLDQMGIPQVICSEVFFDAYADITRHFLRECPIKQRVAPAHLSATPDLYDVAVGWIKIE